MALVGAAVLGGVIVGLVVGFWSALLAQKIGDLAARLVSWLKRVVRRGPVKWDGEALRALSARRRSGCSVGAGT